MPQESTCACTPHLCRISRHIISAAGLRQILPRQTKRILYTGDGEGNLLIRGRIKGRESSLLSARSITQPSGKNSSFCSKMMGQSAWIDPQIRFLFSKLFKTRSGGDSNPRYGFMPVRPFSKRVLSASQPPLQLTARSIARCIRKVNCKMCSRAKKIPSQATFGLTLPCEEGIMTRV